LYSFDASAYPTTTGLTSVVPYSSMNILSGEFKFTDEGTLECVSDGQFTLRCANEFDGSEYVRIIDENGFDIIGGTGGVTQDTIDISIEQGSPLITVDMNEGDTIDGIAIQFREEV
jgi:hypothetical protein